MIFSSVNQLNCFLIFLFFGFVFALFFNLFFIVFCLNFSKNYKKIIFKSVFYSIFSIIFIFFINFFNFGKISLSLIFASIFGFWWMNKLLNNLVVFLSFKWYNVVKLKKENKQQNESKLKS